MRQCPYCNSKIKFVDVLKAVNPARIKCSCCKETIAVGTAYAIAGSVAAGALSIAMVALGLQIGMSYVLLLLALVAIGLIVEAGYYLLIVNGTIKISALPPKSRQ